MDATHCGGLAATSAITQKSPYVVRTSFTLWQTTAPMAKVAAERGIKKVVVAVSDYGPGIDAETAFKKTFEAAGGSVVEAIRMPLKKRLRPVNTEIKAPTINRATPHTTALAKKAVLPVSNR